MTLRVISYWSIVVGFQEIFRVVCGVYGRRRCLRIAGMFLTDETGKKIIVMESWRSK